MDKEPQRSMLIAVRKTVPSKDIPMHLLDNLELPELRSIHVYQPNLKLNEVNTSGIISWLKSQWPTVRIHQSEQSRDAAMHIDHLDAIIVPVVAFDANCNRIGMGGGWYDRFLAMHPEAKKIGLAYDKSEVQKIEPEPHDVRLDLIITPTRIIESE